MTKKPLTIIYSLYNVQDKLKQIHIDNWKTYPDELKENINIILVDDCSDTPFDLELDFPINLTVARITTDVGYNIGGAKNLGFYLASKGWCFSTDIDHILPAEECKKCLSLRKKRNKLYQFYRYLPNGVLYEKIHGNTYMIHKEDFWGVGGYDEDFTPRYGYEDTWLKFLLFNTGIRTIGTNIHVILYNVPHQEEFLSYPIKRREGDRLINKQIYDHKSQLFEKGKYQQTLSLRFSYEITKEYHV